MPVESDQPGTSSIRRELRPDGVITAGTSISLRGGIIEQNSSISTEEQHVSPCKYYIRRVAKLASGLRHLLAKESFHNGSAGYSMMAPRWAHSIRRFIAIGLLPVFLVGMTGVPSAFAQAPPPPPPPSPPTPAPPSPTPTVQPPMAACPQQEGLFGGDLMTQALPSSADILERAVSSKDYRLGPGDRLIVNIWRTGKPANTFEITVPPEGKVFFPALGDVVVAGLTLDGFRQRVGQVMARRLPGFQVSVLLTGLRSFRVLVVGEVRQPGPTVANAVTRLTEVLAVACINSLGSYRAITVRGADGKASRHDLYRFIASGDLAQNPLMNDGVIVSVPRIYGRVKVAGAVGRPGTYEIKRGDRLRDILALAGGVTPDAFLERAEVSRLLPAGGAENRQTILINLDRLMNDPASVDNVLLQPADEVQVYGMSALRGGSVGIGGAVRQPGSYELTRGMRIGDLLFRSGGLLPDASLQHAQLERTVDGKRTVLPLRLDRMILDNDESVNVLLQPSDSVFVPSLLALAPVVFVEGRVKTPGGYAWRQNETVTTLLTRAGGPLLGPPLDRSGLPVGVGGIADLKAAYLNRATGDGKRQRISVDLYGLLVNQDSTKDIGLLPGDVLVVPSVLQQVYVQGYVIRQGAYPYEPNRTVRHYLGLAGLNPQADPGKVVVRRQDGTVVGGLDTLAEAGDVILVPRNTLRGLLEFLGLFLPWLRLIGP